MENTQHGAQHVDHRFKFIFSLTVYSSVSKTPEPRIHQQMLMNFKRIDIGKIVSKFGGFANTETSGIIGNTKQELGADYKNGFLPRSSGPTIPEVPRSYLQGWGCH